MKLCFQNSLRDVSRHRLFISAMKAATVHAMLQKSTAVDNERTERSQRLLTTSFGLSTMVDLEAEADMLSRRADALQNGALWVKFVVDLL